MDEQIPKKKTKFERTTQEQLTYFVNFCKMNPELQSGKNSPKSPQILQILWAELSEKMNGMRGPTRTPAKWKENLGVWKSQLRSRARKRKAQLMLTGGGPFEADVGDFEKLALETFGAAAVEGVPGIGTLGVMTSSSATLSSTANPTSSATLSPSAIPSSTATLSSTANPTSSATLSSLVESEVLEYEEVPSLPHTSRSTSAIQKLIKILKEKEEIDKEMLATQIKMLQVQTHIADGFQVIAQAIPKLIEAIKDIKK